MTIHHRSVEPIVGCDIAKQRLDLYFTASGRHESCVNEPAALAALARRLASSGAFVVFEATSVYDRALREALGRAGVAFARVNPGRARAFARAAGFLAKTDRVDAAMLASLGRALAPRRTVEPSPERRRLADLLQRRRQLVEVRKQDKTRLRQVHDRFLADDIRHHIAYLHRRIDRLEHQIAALIKAAPELEAQRDLLCSAPGVGVVTALTLIAEMPELGQLDRRAAAALAGLAPLAVESGAYRGHRRIAGGRSRLRRALYLAALTARKSSPYAPLHDRLLRDGKPPKLAIIAVARKLLVTLNAMLRDQTTFQPSTA